MFLNTGGRMYSLSGAGSLTTEADTTILLFTLGIHVMLGPALAFFYEKAVNWIYKAPG